MLVNAGGHVHAVGKQLVVGRRTLGAAQRGAPAPARGGAADRRHQPQRQAVRPKPAAFGRAEAGRGGANSIAVGIDACLLQPAADRQHRAPWQRQRLQREQGLVARQRAGHEGLFAQRLKVQPLGLQTQHAVQRAAQRGHCHRRLRGLQPQLTAAALESGAHRAAACHLFMLVAGGAGLQRHAGERPAQAAPLTGQLQPFTLHADGDVGLDGDAVVVAQAVHRQAEVAVGIGPRRTHRARAAAARAVDDLAARGLGLAVHHRHKQRRALVVAVAPGGVHMPVQAVGAAFQQHGAGGFTRGAAQPQLGAAADADQRIARDAVVQGVDDATGGVAAVQQRGRAAQHLDALDHQRVHRHGVVEAEVGRIG